jgi:hypothetical protein
MDCAKKASVCCALGEIRIMPPSQKELLDVFAKLKRLLKKYEPPFTSKLDIQGKYDLWSIKNVFFAKKMRKEVYFAGLIVQSSYVGFYYMPVYAKSDIKKLFSKEILGTLKGKACFHIKSLDKRLEQDIAKALKIGFDLYKERGWV